MNTKLKKIICSIFDANKHGYVDFKDIANVLQYVIIGILVLSGYLKGMYMIIYNTDYLFGDQVSIIDFICLMDVIVLSIIGIMIIGAGICNIVIKIWNKIKYKKIIVCEYKKI